MARNRVIYQSEALYVSNKINSTTSGDHAQLRRVQSANYNYSVQRTDVNQFGQLARIDAIVIEQPTVGLDLTYYLGDGFNERAMGFVLNTGGGADIQFSSGHMGGDYSGANYYILTSPEGADANIANTSVARGLAAPSPTVSNSIIGIGNAYVTDYKVDFAVGAIPTVSVTLEGTNIMSQTNLSGNSTGFTGVQIASIDPTAGTKKTDLISLFHAQEGTSGIAGNKAPTALRPGDVTLSLLTSGIANSGFAVQSCSISLPLARESIQKLGSRFAVVKVMTFPILATINVSATLTDIDARNLADQIDSNNTQDIVLTVKNTAGNATRTAMVYKLKQCKLDSEAFSSSIGSNKSVDLTFSTQIGGANDGTNGVFVSGESNVPAFITTRGGTDYATYGS
jgi:hypothetical protein